MEKIQANQNTIKPIKWLLRHAEKERFKMVVLIILNAVLSAVSVAYAFTLKTIVKGATSAIEGNGDGKNLIILGALLSLGVIGLQFLLRFFIGFLSENIKGKIEIKYKSHIFSSLLKKKYGEITKYHSGEIMNRLSTDIYIVSDGITTIFPSVVAAITRMVFAIFALFAIAIDWVYAVALVSAGLIIFLVVTLLKKKLKSLHKQAQSSEGKTRAFMQESVENILAIKAFSINDRVIEQANEYQQSNFKVKMRRKNYAVLGSSFHHLVFSLGYVFTMIYGGIQIYKGNMSYDGLTAILQLVNNIQMPFMQLTNVFPEYYAMLASTERLIELENLNDEKTLNLIDRDSTYEKMQYLSGENINFTYDKKPVICGGSFKINKGDFAVIYGISGIGKSTLIKVILGVYDLCEGKLSIVTNNEKIKIDNSTRSLFSYVPQGNMVFSGSLLDNLKFVYPNATEKEIDEALKISCAYEFVNELPNGVNTIVGEGGLGLSEGQIQRIAIARAVLTKSPIILLDEATSALDESTERQVLSNIKEMKNYTVIIISHKKAAFEVCNTRLSIENGVIVQE